MSDFDLTLVKTNLQENHCPIKSCSRFTHKQQLSCLESNYSLFFNCSCHSISHSVQITSSKLYLCIYIFLFKCTPCVWLHRPTTPAIAAVCILFLQSMGQTDVQLVRGTITCTQQQNQKVLCCFEVLDSDSSNDVDHIKKRSSNDPV